MSESPPEGGITLHAGSLYGALLAEYGMDNGDRAIKVLAAYALRYAIV